MSIGDIRMWICWILACVCLGIAGAQEAVKVCPSCGGTGRMVSGVCVQCKRQKVLRENGDFVNGMSSRVRSGLARDAQNGAVFVCQSCGGTGRMRSGGRCLRYKGCGLVREDGLGF